MPKAKLNHQEISSIERMYMDILKMIFSSNSFRKDLRKLEKNIKKSKKQLDSIYKKSNKIDIAVERLVRYHIYRHFSIMGIYASPVSSDLSLIGDICVLNIDSKTVDKDTNGTDVLPGIIEYNQVTFQDNSIMNGISKEGVDFDGYSFQGRLPEFYKKKPFICFFLKVVYTNNGRKGFELDPNIQLYCIPHKTIVKKLYLDGLIYGVKTYDYLDDQNEINKRGAQYAVKTIVDTSWKEVTPPGGNAKRWLDDSITCPMNIKKPVIWGKKNSKNIYYVVKGGQTFRIQRPLLENRIDKSGQKWKGFIDIKI